MRADDFKTTEELNAYIEELERECQTYRDAAALYGVDAMTMLALAKSQIKTCADNIRLTEKLEAYENSYNALCEMLLSMITPKEAAPRLMSILQKRGICDRKSL